MVNITFKSTPVSKVTDIKSISAVSKDSEHNGGNGESFQEILERKQAKAGDKPEPAIRQNETPATLPAGAGYGFVTYYNGKAQSSCFYMLNSISDMKA